jgi:hypothetical protein
MNESEMRAINRLLFAVEASQKSIPYAVSLSDVRREFEAKQAEAAATREAREAELVAAMAAVRALLS